MRVCARVCEGTCQCLAYVPSARVAHSGAVEHPRETAELVGVSGTQSGEVLGLLCSGESPQTLQACGASTAQPAHRKVLRPGDT